VSEFYTAQRVRLIAAERPRQPEMRDAVGIVHAIHGEVIEVEWPCFRSHVRAELLEPAP
jgi:hypothetical protein